MDLDWFYNIKRDNWNAYLNLVSFMILDVDHAFEEPMLPYYSGLLQRLDYLNQLGEKISLEETLEIKEVQEEIESLDKFLLELREKE